MIKVNLLEQKSLIIFNFKKILAILKMILIILKENNFKINLIMFMNLEIKINRSMIQIIS